MKKIMVIIGYMLKELSIRMCDNAITKNFNWILNLATFFKQFVYIVYFTHK